ncbi:polysaccharide biosynthesis/export family protein [Pigmentiphaga litoralis]|uniref:Protein involved in polysaccharide export with SLBB domain n=1 Tax=Pigmentiphaga litoralis TaxID=516702 RepID=A0A7Y9LMI8_9BURK|nr:polysaccharide biosynthesis/export family protein [Pigmentiphaga litoralis]NYE24233.1 protein involved in polysaccharide export with SLBB domain [Pigmentiphaga litoralis]NYE82153.1 protein involved in polysaccharide export with SLBB domain [Pigmentiphaga litoralis]
MTYTYLHRPLRGTVAAVLAALVSTSAFAQFSLNGLGSTAPTSGGGTYVSPSSVTGSGMNGARATSATNSGIGTGTSTGANNVPGMGVGTSPMGAGNNSLDSGPNTLRDSRGPQDLDMNGEQGPDASRRGKKDGNAPARQRQISQFQQFVQQSTGRLLPVYGQDLFDLPQVTYSPDGGAPARDDYVLGPGDELQVQVWGGVDYKGSVTIDRNGQASIPRVGVVNLAGTRVADVEAVLRQSIGKTFTNFNLNASLGKLRSIQVYVVGQAQQPGTYNLSSLGTLVNALFASGGPNANGSMRNIELKRGGKVVTTFDLYDFIGRGEKGRDVPLASGDVIVIPPVGPRVAIAGALDNAAIYELKPGQSVGNSLGDILALGGGVPTLATSHKALIERVAPQQNPPRQVQDLALDNAGLATPLRDGDIVTLLGISPAFANAVTLQGNVAAPLRYRWFKGMKVRDLIPERDALITADYYVRKNLLVQNAEALGSDATKAGNQVDRRVRSMVDEINWDYAVVERLDRDKLRTQLIPFNLGRAVLQGDESQNLVLQPGDVVTILSQNDLRLPAEKRTRLVRVEGEVSAPGIYEVLPGETMGQLIQRVGGTTPQAYVYGIEIDRESVRQKQQQNLDLLIRRLESQQQSQILYIMANRNTADAAAQAAVAQQQQALARSQLEALRKLRSNGRIALEMSAGNPSMSIASLPDLPLEDGDRVMVPTVPSFVSAVGAINNENVFIYKNGRTVGEVIKSAGVRPEADLKQMFVVRADGSILASSTGFFSSGVESVALMPGDTIVVPEKLDRETTGNFVARQLKDWTQIFSQLGLGVAALSVIRDL